MKKQLFLSFCILGLNAFSQNVTIPDANFKNYLISNLEINTNSDNEIQISEASNYSDSLFCVSLSISDMTGIEAFTNLKFLSCVNNSIANLDLSQNVALEDLICAMNPITSLDLTLNVNLKNLRCAYNQLSNLDLSTNINLEYLYCEANTLTSLDLTNLPNLKELVCYNNQLMTLDLSSNIALKKLDCSDNDLTSINSSNLFALETFECFGNQINMLDLANSPNLTLVRCFGNYLTSLDLSNNPQLVTLDCPYNAITAMDLSQNANLQTAYLFSNQLSSLNIANGNNTNLSLLWTEGNNLSCIQVDNPTFSNTNWTGSNFTFDAASYFSSNCSAGMIENVTKNIELFPNPTQDVCYINVYEPANFTITNVKGELIKSGKLSQYGSQLDLGQIERGIYFLTVNFKDKSSIISKICLN